IASTTSACCPIALHIRILASGSCLTISRTASMPPMSGITMSIVTRSGLSWRYFSTACVPVFASRTISNPAWARMSVIIVRMKMASSQTRTVWVTARSLRRQNRSYQRRHVEYNEQLTVPPAHRAHERRIDPGQPRAVLERRVAARQHVRHRIHCKANHPLLAIAVLTAGDLEDDRRAVGFRLFRRCRGGSTWRGLGGLPQRAPPFHDRHQRAADIHEPRHDRWRARNARRWEARKNLPHLVYLGRTHQSPDSEQK